MFRKNVGIHDGIIIAEKKESTALTSIHMMFMNFDITVLWLDNAMVIVDKVLAKKWKLVYVPKKPAQYVVELHSSKFSDYSVGDKLEILR
jgi:uncharacterized membrane protein (UPF0127 family)